MSKQQTATTTVWLMHANLEYQDIDWATVHASAQDAHEHLAQRYPEMFARFKDYAQRHSIQAIQANFLPYVNLYPDQHVTLAPVELEVVL